MEGVIIYCHHLACSRRRTVRALRWKRRAAQGACLGHAELPHACYACRMKSMAARKGTVPHCVDLAVANDTIVTRFLGLCFRRRNRCPHLDRYPFRRRHTKPLVLAVSPMLNLAGSAAIHDHQALGALAEHDTSGTPGGGGTVGALFVRCSRSCLLRFANIRNTGN